ncbi:MAG: hypothetical protein OWS74_01590 [Firmicutes bacterium]|nr:hypothetical protein [Bacillota bacterium]
MRNEKYILRERKMKTKKELKELIIEANKELMEKEMFPLEVKDGGWRYIIYEYSLNRILDELGNDLSGFPALKELYSLAVYDLDFNGGYYWVQYDYPPDGVTTPAMRFMQLK